MGGVLSNVVGYGGRRLLWPDRAAAELPSPRGEGDAHPLACLASTIATLAVRPTPAAVRSAGRTGSPRRSSPYAAGRGWRSPVPCRDRRAPAAPCRAPAIFRDASRSRRR